MLNTRRILALMTFIILALANLTLPIITITGVVPPESIDPFLLPFAFFISNPIYYSYNGGSVIGPLGLSDLSFLFYTGVYIASTASIYKNIKRINFIIYFFLVDMFISLVFIPIDGLVHIASIPISLISVGLLFSVSDINLRENISLPTRSDGSANRTSPTILKPIVCIIGALISVTGAASTWVSVSAIGITATVSGIGNGIGYVIILLSLFAVVSLLYEKPVYNQISLEVVPGILILTTTIAVMGDPSILAPDESTTQLSKALITRGFGLYLTLIGSIFIIASSTSEILMQRVSDSTDSGAWVCSNCDQRNPGSNDYCENCGESNNICSGCGSSLSSTAKFCGKCGEEVKREL